MNPKKAKEFILPTAEATGADEALVKDFVSFFWKEARKSVVEMRGHHIFIESLGTFRVKTWKVPEVEQRYREYLEAFERRRDAGTMSFQKFSIMKDVELRLEKLANLQKMIDEDVLKKQSVKEKRNGKITQGSPEAPQANT